MQVLWGIRIHGKMKTRPAQPPCHRVDHGILHPNARVIQLRLMPRRDERRIAFMPDERPRPRAHFRQRYILQSHFGRIAKQA